MIENKKIITAPIFYINGLPHLGHLYTCIAVDVLRRFEIAMGRSSCASFGTDEHGQKVELACLEALKSNSEEMLCEYANKMTIPFKNLLAAANVISNAWIRTTDNDHKEVASWLWREIEANGFFYEKKYVGWYAKADEAYYREEEVLNNVAIPTGSKVEWVEEDCMFFKLSAFREQLVLHYHRNKDSVQPQSRYNEVLGLLSQDLPDLAVSRTRFKWGISCPNHNDHIMYVWLDALANYLTFLARSGGTFNLIGSMIHVIGKDILKFHAIYWPALLLAAKLPLPKQIFAHGWLLVKETKMSKSRGNFIDPFTLLEKYGCDQVRYFFMKAINFGNDSNFSEEAVEQIYNAELINEIGNLAQRVLVFCYNKYGGTLYCDNTQAEILRDWDVALNNAEHAMKNQDITKYIIAVRKAIMQTNKYMNDNQPWLAQDPKEVMSILCLCIQRMSILLWPVMPHACEKIAAMMGVTDITVNSWSICLAHKISQKPTPLFQMIDNFK